MRAESVNQLWSVYLVRQDCSTHGTVFQKLIFLCILNFKSKGIHLVLKSPLWDACLLTLLSLFTDFAVAYVGLGLDPLASSLVSIIWDYSHVSLCLAWFGCS